MLRFSLSRRLIVALGGILAMISGYAAGEYVRQQGFPLAVALIATVATVVVLGVLVLLLDGVKLA